jgi:tRNA threonylcarbamoyl adenosine modification protein YjeE
MEALPEGTLRNAAETEALGAALACRLRPGQVLALVGGLGAGKTTLVRGLARALGVGPELVSSPTFTLMNLFDLGESLLIHADLYRVKDPGEIEAVGLLEWLGHPEALVVVEWPEAARTLLPGGTWWLALDFVPGGRQARWLEPPAPSGGRETPQEAQDAKHESP